MGNKPAKSGSESCKYGYNELRDFILNKVDAAQRELVIRDCRADKHLYGELVHVYEQLVLQLVEHGDLGALNEKKIRFIEGVLGWNNIEQCLDLHRHISGLESLVALDGRTTDDGSVRAQFTDHLIGLFRSYVLARRFLLGTIASAEAELAIDKKVLEDAEQELVFDYVHGYLTGEEREAFLHFFLANTPDALQKIAAEAKRLTLLDVDWSKFES